MCDVVESIQEWLPQVLVRFSATNSLVFSKPQFFSSVTGVVASGSHSRPQWFSEKKVFMKPTQRIKSTNIFDWHWSPLVIWSPVVLPPSFPTISLLCSLISPSSLQCGSLFHTFKLWHARIRLLKISILKSSVPDEIFSFKAHLPSYLLCGDFLISFWPDGLMILFSGCSQSCR